MSSLLAIQRMAARLRTLHVLRQQSLQLRHPHFRARALLSVVRAALSIDRELARWQVPHVQPRWAEHYLALCMRDLLRATPLRLEPAALSSWAALRQLLNDAVERRAGLSDVEERRVDGLRRGLALRGRTAHLQRVAVAVETRPDELPSLLSALPAGERGVAERLKRSGIYELGAGRAFIADADDESFAPSLLRAQALCRLGKAAQLERLLRELLRPQRRRWLPLLEAARYVAGEPHALRRLLAQPSVAGREQALWLVVQHELAQARTLDAEHVARRIAAPRLRQEALRAVLQHELRDGTVRRPLLRELAPAPRDLARALLLGERAVACADGDAMWEHAGVVDAFLEQALRPEPAWGHPALPDGAWDRALRLALALALRGVQGARVGNVIRAAWPLLQRPSLERELRSELPSCPARLRALCDCLPEDLRFVGDFLSLLVIERALLVPNDAAVFAQPSAELWQCLRAPHTGEAAFVAGALFDSQAPLDISRSATSSLRAAFDLGVAQSPRLASRRTVLIRAVRATLRSHEPMPDALIELRLATLRALDAAPLSELLLVLTNAKVSVSAQRRALLLVARHDLKLAQRTFYERFAVLTESGEAAADVYTQLERAKLFEPGTASAFKRLQQRLVARFGARVGAAFWPGFALAWQEARGDAPPRRVLELLEHTLRLHPAHRDGGEAFQALAQHVEGLRRQGVAPLFDATQSSLELDWLVTLTEPYPAAAWDLKAWLQAVRWGRQRAGEVEPSVVRDFARRLRGGAQTRARLLAGAPPLPSLEQPLAVDERHELRFLDKRRDFLAFLRVADCVPCCFASDGNDYTKGMENLRWIYRLWQDPLSFALHLHCEEHNAPVGFVFGGFGIAEEPVLLLNGIYLKRQRERLRLAVLETIEQQLAVPLGIAEIGVASRHGGRGALPGTYRYTSRRLTRVRALRSAGGALERKVYDDIGNSVNGESWMDLYFRKLGLQNSRQSVGTSSVPKL